MAADVCQSICQLHCCHLELFSQEEMDFLIVCVWLLMSFGIML